MMGDHVRLLEYNELFGMVIPVVRKMVMCQARPA